MSERGGQWLLVIPTDMLELRMNTANLASICKRYHMRSDCQSRLYAADFRGVLPHARLTKCEAGIFIFAGSSAAKIRHFALLTHPARRIRSDGRDPAPRPCQHGESCSTDARR